MLYIFKRGQPALLYLVPALFIGTFISRLCFDTKDNDILKYRTNYENEKNLVLKKS